MPVKENPSACMKVAFACAIAAAGLCAGFACATSAGSQPSNPPSWQVAEPPALAMAAAPGGGAGQDAPPGPDASPPASEVTADPWPKTAEAAGTKYTIYQPQIESWDDWNLHAHAAVSVLAPGAKDPVFGAIEIAANTMVDRQARTVHFESVQIVKATFPSVPGSADAYRDAIQRIASDEPATYSLDRLEQALAIEGAERKAMRVAVANSVPRFVFSQTAAVLVLVHGEPVWRAVQGTSLWRALNTRALLLRDADGRIYFHVLDGFLAAPSLRGPWAIADSPPAAANEMAVSLAKQGLVDLMEGPADPATQRRPSLKSGVPEVVIATEPAEVIITGGPMEWAALEGTQLLYVKNTTGNVFRDLYDQQLYILVTGRWFRAPDLAGPWKHVPGRDLPVDFALIADTSPKENVKASVPGTAQSQETEIAAQIPTQATVARSKARFTPVVTGAPILEPVPDTPLSSVFNSPQAILRVSASQWYAVENGLWFTAASLSGPWSVASKVPAVIYSIPPNSPLYYVTFVKVYAATPQYVVVGYTPGYMGVVVAPDGMVVYGTGYTYVSYVGTTVWYPAPVTYGYAASVTYTPWTGFAVGFAVGWGMAAGHYCYAPVPYWGPMPYAYHGAAYGPHGSAAAWGPGGFAATSGNVYHQYGATSGVTRTSGGYNAWTGNGWSNKVGTSYNSVTGERSAGQRGSVSNTYTGGYAYGSRGATYNPSTGVAAAGSRVTVGNAYTGQQTTYARGTVSGPGGQTTHVAQSGNQYYADRNGNVYNYDASSGQSRKYDGNGSWSDESRTASSNAMGANTAQARQAGDSRSASSGWGGSWGGESSHSGGWSGDGGGGGRSWGGGRWGGGGGGGGFGGFRGRR